MSDTGMPGRAEQSNNPSQQLGSNWLTNCGASVVDIEISDSEGDIDRERVGSEGVMWFEC